jgi:hypothetical protein
MPHPSTSNLRRAGSRAPVLSLLVSAALLMPAQLSHAAEPETAAPAQPSATSESPPSAVGPLSPVRREPPASAQSSKQGPATTKPTITMPAPTPTATPLTDTSASSSPPLDTKSAPKQTQQSSSSSSPKPAKPPAKEAEHTPPAASASKLAKPEQKVTQEATPPRPHRKPPSTRSTTASVNAPSERRPSGIERRDRIVEVDRMPIRERIYREEYGWSGEPPFVARQGMPYPPPRVYAEGPDDVGPAPFAPPWSYRYRSFAWGPYPGMPGPRFGPPY